MSYEPIFTRKDWTKHYNPTYGEESKILLDMNPKKIIDVYKKFKPSERYSHQFGTFPRGSKNINSYLDSLKKEGLDIGDQGQINEFDYDLEDHPWGN